MAFIIQERRRNNRSATKVKLFCNCPFVTARVENFFPLAFQCIIVIHLTIASVVSLVALYRITIMSRCSSLVFKRAVAPEICDYGLTNLEG